MASAEEVKESLDSFASDCNANERLKVMNRDWNRTISIHATDLKRDYTMLTRAGSVTVSEGKPTGVDMAIEADSEILTQIFYGEVSPNIPYNEGTLRVKGTEQDVLHLDFITAMLWEE